MANEFHSNEVRRPVVGTGPNVAGSADVGAPEGLAWSATAQSMGRELLIWCVVLVASRALRRS